MKINIGFEKIRYAKHKVNPESAANRNFWVPASVHHPQEGAAATRHLFFVYGGVSIQTKINQIPGNGRPLGENPAVRGSFNRQNIIRGFQSHHIISHTKKVTKNHQLLKLAGLASRDLNRPINRIFLPTEASQHPTRTIHRGRHTAASMRDVARDMKKAVEKGTRENWSQAQYRQALRKIISDNRQQLRAGNIALNSIHRPWASNPPPKKN